MWSSFALRRETTSQPIGSVTSDWQECHRPDRQGMVARSVEVAVASMASDPEISISEAAPRAPRLGCARQGSRQVKGHYSEEEAGSARAPIGHYHWPLLRSQISTPSSPNSARICSRRWFFIRARPDTSRTLAGRCPAAGRRVRTCPDLVGRVRTPSGVAGRRSGWLGTKGGWPPLPR